MQLTNGEVRGAMPLIHNDPEHWHERAAEARALSEKMSDPEDKKTMLEVAEKYERVAARALERMSANRSAS